MIGASASLNLAMVGYHYLASSALGDAYAQLASLTGLINISNVISIGVATNLTKIFSRDVELAGSGALKTRLRLWGPKLALGTLGFCLFLTLFGVLLKDFLRLPSFSLLLGAVAVLGCAISVTLVRSALQGLHRFGILALSLVSEGMGRVLSTWVMLCLGWGVFGALGGPIVGVVAALAIAVWGFRGMGRARPLPKAELGREGWRKGLADAAWDTSALALFSLICYLDIFVAKHAWDEGRASLYSRAALVAKSFLYLAGALNMVLLPVVSAARASKRDSRPVLMRFMGLVLLLQMIGLAVVWFQTEWCIRLLCGPDPAFQALAPLVRQFSASVVPLALFNVSLLYLLAHHSRKVVLLLLGLTLVYGITLQAPGLDELDMVLRLRMVSWAALLSSLWLAWRSAPLRKRAS